MPNSLNQSLTIYRRNRVEVMSGYARSTLYLRMSQGLWPKPVSLGARAVGWPAYEVDAINAARIAGKSDLEIRELVQHLESKRRHSLNALNTKEVKA